MILLFLANGVESYELSAFMDVFCWNNNWGSKKIKIQTVGLHEKIVCMGGSLTILPDKKLSEVNIDDYTALAIPGGYSGDGFFEDVYSDRFLDLIREFDRNKKPIGSICVGAMPIGKSGVLKNRSATTYKNKDNKRRNELTSFGVNVLDRKIVIDRNIITSESPSTAIKVSLKLLELLTDQKNRKSIADMMGFQK